MFVKELLENSSLLIYILSGIMLLSVVIQLSYYLGVFSRVFRYKAPTLRRKKIGVSVIICAKNEAENLSKHLPAFLSQDYPEYEVFVVNDCSTDNTEEVLMDLKVKYPQLRSTTIPIDNKFTHGKKLAVTVGVKGAKYDHLLFSDADCKPATDKWISSMSRHFSKDTELILGIGKYEKRRGLLNLLIRYETFFTAMQYIAFAIGEKAYMGVGRNMAYHRELFFKNKGFASHLKVLSGDDDLFVNEASTKYNTAIEIEEDSFTYSIPPANFRAWFKQKKRHISAGKHYTSRSKFRLGLEYISRLLLYITFIGLLFHDHWKWLALGAFILQLLIKATLVKLTMRRLSEKDLLLPSLLLEPLMLILLGMISLSNTFRPQKPKWN